MRSMPAVMGLLAGMGDAPLAEAREDVPVPPSPEWTYAPERKRRGVPLSKAGHHPRTGGAKGLRAIPGEFLRWASRNGIGKKRVFQAWTDYDKIDLFLKSAEADELAARLARESTQSGRPAPGLVLYINSRGGYAY